MSEKNNYTDLPEDILNDKRLTVLGRAGPFALAVVSPHDVKLVDKNARYMAPEVYRQLVLNIQRDGQLSSVPFVFRNEQGDLIVISGNHRVMAARDAGLEKIPVMFNVGPADYDWVRYIQLSHNAIVGEDDLQILKELYEEIRDPDLRLATGIDDAIFDEINNARPLHPVVIQDTVVVALLFDEENAALVRDVLERVNKEYAPDEIWWANREQWEEFISALQSVGDRFNVASASLALSLLFRYLDKVLDTIEISLGAAPSPRGKSVEDGRGE